ncbi:hypothetical protein C8Q69DRAFT_225149 [Paecilomyces variotii]|uniref:Uncharacterized protein n=1 Tax=Byssochlamys spectabilis TaxID=264951 RepID=A0A443HVU6_BYSSP|nr:hypothetical protein C8Q69DRAFT_225149 [Paecilomyces variotii]RWQ95953.1 hypothetical protein C8Q69DRAFT_225149 [Paecilomyces variotii]
MARPCAAMRQSSTTLRGSALIRNLFRALRNDHWRLQTDERCLEHDRLRVVSDLVSRSRRKVEQVEHSMNRSQHQPRPTPAVVSQGDEHDFVRNRHNTLGPDRERFRLICIRKIERYGTALVRCLEITQNIPFLQRGGRLDARVVRIRVERALGHRSKSRRQWTQLYKSRRLVAWDSRTDGGFLLPGWDKRLRTGPGGFSPGTMVVIIVKASWHFLSVRRSPASAS